jgi:16S rRNA C967 or C1407 C5-methylase (RsmB/RsmF family)
LKRSRRRSASPSQASSATPSRFLSKLAEQLFADAEAQASFVAALTQPQPMGGALLWLHRKPQTSLFRVEPPLAWQPSFVERLQPGQQPGKHPAHEQGDYYCLDFSSVFAATPMLELPTAPNLVIDLCAAPGGKSLLAWRMLQPQQLVCNEVIGKRLGMLMSNLRRCQIHPCQVFNQEVETLSQALAGSANVLLVDAPCSGQSLLVKGEAAPGCFHPVTINHNANRQKRILANAVGLLAPQGYLLYTTCTFAPAENEQVSTWLQAKFPQLRPVEVPALVAYQSHLADFPCYRLWPQSGLGAGAFAILWQKIDAGVREEAACLDLAWLNQHRRWQSSLL